VEENQLSSKEAQNLWNEEASKLAAGDDSLAADSIATAPETPQAELQLELEQEEDPYAGLSPTLRAKLAQIDELAQANGQLLHQVKITEGRVAAMQREAQQARQVAIQNAPSQTAIASAAKNPEKWDELKQDFPEWAGAMEEYVAAKIGTQQAGLTPEQVSQLVQQQVSQSKAEMIANIEEARIEGKYGDWKTTVNTPEFAAWFAVQSFEVKALAESPQSKDAIKMLDMFSDSRTRSASDIRQERGARLAAAATTRPGQTPPPKTLGDMSPAELWNYEAKKRERELKERGY
jgi:hypothetical protein